MKKKLLVGSFLVLVVFGLVLVFGKDMVLRRGIEEGATQASGTESTLDAAALSLFSGRLMLTDFAMENPPGFETKNAFQVGKVDVDTAVTSLLGNTVRVEHIIIESPEIALEVGAGKSNLGFLFDHLRPSSDTPSETAPASGKETEPGTPEPAVGRELEVGLVRIVSPKVTLSQSVVGTTRRDYTLGTIELNELGTADRPGTTDLPGLIQQILEAVVASVCEHPDVPPQVVAVLNGEIPSLDEIRGEVKGRVGDVVEKGLQGDTEGVKDSVKDAEKKLKGLFRKKDD